MTIDARAALRQSLIDRSRPGAQSPSAPTIVAENKLPADVVHVPPSAFSDDWSHKPTAPVQMGLRLCSVQTIGDAVRMASRAAWDGHPEPGDVAARDELFREEVQINVLARALTEPQDRSALYFAVAPEAQCRLALSSGGVRFLWERLERLMVTTSPLSAQADDGEVSELCALLAGGALARMPERVAERVRRLLAVVVTELRAHQAEPKATDV